MTTTRSTRSERFFLSRSHGGGYKATIEHRGKYYSCHITDSTLWDDYHGARIFNTRTQAINIMYDICKRENNLK